MPEQDRTEGFALNLRTSFHGLSFSKFISGILGRQNGNTGVRFRLAQA